MRAGEDSPQTNATFGSGVVEPVADTSAGDSEGCADGGWRMMASAAAGTMLGMPFVSSGTFRAAWIEVSQWIAGLQR
jgi:hypothetical protein